jgi:hypothetical protein
MTYGYKQMEDGTLVPHPIDTQLPKPSMECPNCITPWKCNGPHLEAHSIYHYSSEQGYYIKEGELWVFYPFEKALSEIDLKCIAETVRFLNNRNRYVLES